MDLFTYKVEDYVAEVKLVSPPANALSQNILKELDQLLDILVADENVRVILLQGEGRFFSAGADIKEFTTLSTKEEFTILSRNGQKVFEKIETCKKPVIAAIHGAALGGGLELAMACHIRYATETAKLGLPELSLGIIPGFAGTQRLTRYVGTSKAAEMMFTSDPISGLEAEKCGLVSKAFSEDEFQDKVLALAKKMALKSPIGLAAVLELMTYSRHENFQTGVEKEAEIFGNVFASQDAKEGVNAFVEKRKATFIGK